MPIATIQQNLNQLHAELAAHHRLHNITLINVTKNHPAATVQMAYACGERDFGESRVQELVAKDLLLTESAPARRWHFIGHLQSNKVAPLVALEHLVAIHSVDSLKLLNKILTCHNQIRSSNLKLFLQVNTSAEDEKSGFTHAEDVMKAVQTLVDFNLKTANSKIAFAGLMTIGSIRAQDFEAAAHASFQQLTTMANTISTKFCLPCELSMGMSDDYALALTYPTNYLRIGSKIFGERSA